MRDYTSNNIIESIKRIGSIPDAQSLFSTADFLGFINSEIESLVVPMILSHHQDYFVTYQDIEVVAGQETYNLPSSSIAMGMREAVYVTESGTYKALEPLSLSKVSQANFRLSEGYYFLGNQIVLHPKPQATRTLRVFYHKDPNEVVANNSAGQIISINTGTNQVTLSNVPTTWTTSNTFDAIDSQPGFDNQASNLTASTISAPVLTLGSVEGLEINDWVAISGFSPIPQIPKNAFKIVEQAAAVKCLEAMGKAGKAQIAEGKLQQYMQAFSKTIAPRSKGKAQVISANGQGLYQVGRSSRNFRRNF